MEAKRESRNLLGIKQEDADGDLSSLLAILSDKPTSCQRLLVSTASALQSKPRRTLLDFLRDDEEQALGNNISLLKNTTRRNMDDVETSESRVSTNTQSTRGGAAPARRSLMALLEEQMGLDGYGHAMHRLDEEDTSKEPQEILDKCCVCMVRHKGAAFIPCGHAFCRMCSRELQLQRGNCPLCNSKILQILDIF